MKSGVCAKTVLQGKTILVVDDEEAVLHLVCTIFERAGARILNAGNGAEALEICQKHDGPIDLVVTDIEMPEIGGIDLARCISERIPALPVLFMSGSGHPNSSGQLDHRTKAEADFGFIAKPFTPLQLLNAVTMFIPGSN